MNLVQGDLYKSQKSCEGLDTSAGFEVAAESWFWPARPRPEEQNSDEEEEEVEDPGIEPEDQLKLLTQYLRYV